MHIFLVYFRADYRMAKMLLTRGAQPNLPDLSANTPLHTATIFGHMELVKLLLQHGADVYKKGQHGALPIHMAAREGHANLVRLFCQFSEVSFTL
jgi:ankyrin repeat protein